MMLHDEETVYKQTNKARCDRLVQVMQFKLDAENAGYASLICHA